jgi:hypothetical protein
MMAAVVFSRFSRSLRVATLAVGLAAVGVTVFVAGAWASVRPASAAPSASSICSHVSAASVSAIIGYKVPAPTASTTHLPATKKNFEISSVDTSCVYGAETSVAALKKVVILEYGVSDKAFTAAELQQSIKTSETENPSVKLKVVPYSGLGVPAYYLTISEAGIFGQAIEGVVGTTTFGASVESKTVSESTVAALAKLSRKL